MTQQQQPTRTSPQSNIWYFYNPQAVSQGKQRFEQQWGRRPNADNWQRSNLTVLKMDSEEEENSEDSESSENSENSGQGSEPCPDTFHRGTKGSQ